MKVKVESYSGVMNNCMCNSCDWSVDQTGNNNPAAECRRHVTQNPTHEVVRVYGSEFIYTQEKL